MTDAPVLNHRRSNGPISGTLEEVDTAADREGQLYPVVVVRRSDGSRRAVHFDQPEFISALARAEPRVGDVVSLTGAGVRVSRPDVYGQEGAVTPPAADWGLWANRAYRRQPGGADALAAEPTPPEPPQGVVRYRRRVRLADGREGFAYDAPEPPKPTQITKDEDGHLVTRRPLG